MNRCALALLVGSVLVGGACENDEARRVTRNDRRQFYVVMESKLRQIDREIARMDGAAGGVDSAYAADVEHLKRDQRNLRERLSAMVAAPDHNWPELKDSVEFYYRGVRAQYGNITTRETRAAAAEADSTSVSETMQTD